MKKVFVGVAVSLLLTVSLLMPAFAENPSETTDEMDRNVKIYVDGVLFTPTDASQSDMEPFIHDDGTIYLPVEVLAEALGKSIEWDSATNSVYIGDPAPQEIVEITVGTAEELIAALGSNKRILLKEGVYNLTAADPGYTNPHVYFGEQHDGPELFLDGIQNLTLQGMGDNQSEIVVEPRYANVINFRNCSNISIENIKAGHTEGGVCSGGVFLFENCANIQISNTLMYGCGTRGLIANRATGIKVSDSTIYGCTNGIMGINFSTDVLFKGCVFRDNTTTDTMVAIEQTSGFTIDSCAFLRNTDADVMFYLSRSENVTIQNTEFIENKARGFATGGDITYDASNRLENNTFDVFDSSFTMENESQ